MIICSYNKQGTTMCQWCSRRQQLR